MDEMIYIAMSGARQTELAQAINSNNLANASTTGFRADLHSFSSAMIEGPGVDSRVNAVIESYGTDFSPGPRMHTGRPLDVAVVGDGFIAVQAPDGSEAYTRAGNLRIEPGGLLTNASGHLVQGTGGPVAIPPYTNITIGKDGTITIRPVGQGPEALSIVDRIKLVNPDVKTLQKGSDGLFYLPEGELAAPDANTRLEPEHLEQSNVSIARTLVNMIELSRQYEMQVNLIKTSKENADASAALMSMG